MGKLLVASFLLSTCLFAQEAPIKGPDRDANTQVSLPQTYKGCVIKSNGKLMLTDSAGKDFVLVRNARSTSGKSAARTESLDSYVGQEVRITASPLNPNDPSLDERSVKSQQPQNPPATLDVEEISKLADHCSSPK